MNAAQIGGRYSQPIVIDDSLVNEVSMRQEVLHSVLAEDGWWIESLNITIPEKNTISHKNGWLSDLSINAVIKE